MWQFTNLCGFDMCTFLYVCYIIIKGFFLITTTSSAVQKKKPLYSIASALYPACPNPHQDSTSEVVEICDTAKNLGLHLGVESYTCVKCHICWCCRPYPYFTDVETRKIRKCVHENEKRFRNVIQRIWILVCISHTGQLLRGTKGILVS